MRKLHSLLPLLFAVAMFVGCKGCKTPEGSGGPLTGTGTGAVIAACAAPAAAELLADASAALQAPEEGWRAALAASAAKYGTEALNCAIEQFLATLAGPARAISPADQRSIDRAMAWFLSQQQTSRAVTPQLTCQQCAGLCKNNPACFNCCCLHHC